MTAEPSIEATVLGLVYSFDPRDSLAIPIAVIQVIR
jgi:hypothetical protein